MSPIAIHDVTPAVISSATSTRSLSVKKVWSPVAISSVVREIRNPIREVIAGIDLGGAIAAGSKPFLNLGLGDPSVYGNFPPAEAALDAIHHSLRSGKSDGYPASVGYAATRQAVADYFNIGEHDSIKKEDIIMTHGASGALESAISVLADHTKNIILPRPLFTAYETMAGSTGCEIRYYNLIPEQNWEIDLASLGAQIDENTACVLINNPCNPCGSNWSTAHLEALARLASLRRVVIVSDEVYAGMAWDVSGPRPAHADDKRVQGKFNPGVFTPYASIATNAPVLTVGAVSKRWLAPGWRLGWVIVSDPQGVLNEVREGLEKWAFRIQGPNSTMQGALPEIFVNTPESFFTKTLADLERVGLKLYERLAQIPGLKPLRPQGAMYLVCGGLTEENFPGFADDKDFVGAFKKEENVLVLPGACFRLEGFVRFVTTVPLPVLMEACDRLEAFCLRHRKA